MKYTKLIYALGSECFVPPIPGTDKPEVVAIRRMSDIEKIEAMLYRVQNVVVIGGGVLGLEAAWELKKAANRWLFWRLRRRSWDASLMRAQARCLQTSAGVMELTFTQEFRLRQSRAKAL